MRTLKFNVKDQTITKDPESDFKQLHKETAVQAVFSFSEDWDGYVKVASFTRAEKELEPKILLHGTTCDIPYEALRGSFFRMSIIGKNDKGKKRTKQILINTNE